MQINRRGTALLYSLIEHRNFELAKTLTPFHYNLDEKLLIQALEQADEHLLEFLLSCGEYTLDNQPLRIEGQTYKSAVHYCFNTCQKQSMAPCLSTLIRHGASLLGKGANGLPLAHTLLSTPNHPLLPALEANKPSTLQSRYFYVQLANLIQNFLMAGGMDDQRRKMLTKAMESYRETAGSFLLSRDLDKGRGNKLRQTVDQFKEEAKQKCSENVINQLEQELDSVLSNELRGHGSMSRMRRANQIFQAAAKFMQEDKIDTWNGQAADLRKLLGM